MFFLFLYMAVNCFDGTLYLHVLNLAVNALAAFHRRGGSGRPLEFRPGGLAQGPVGEAGCRVRECGGVARPSSSS